MGAQVGRARKKTKMGAGEGKKKREILEVRRRGVRWRGGPGGRGAEAGGSGHLGPGQGGP